MAMSMQRFFLTCRWIQHPVLCRLVSAVLFSAFTTLLICGSVLAMAETVNAWALHACFMTVAFMFLLPLALVLFHLPKYECGDVVGWLLCLRWCSLATHPLPWPALFALHQACNTSVLRAAVQENPDCFPRLCGAWNPLCSIWKT